ncbi:hypothetical protein [uncultured Kordia sp.]|uniref:hypothetical protein n=1 Tax=uncultured Kordia sp. TaxID=507699 RepID=UPI00262E0D2F|nr:hypothetical protein [uncultured Kordia sp.]
MKYICILFITSLSLLSCSKQQKQHTENSHKKSYIRDNVTVNEKVTLKTFTCPDFYFKTNKNQADTIVYFFEKAKIATGNQKIELEKMFFCAFPNSFENMENIFGFDSETGKSAALYMYSDNLLSNPIISYFANLNSIPSKDFYDKYINICVNGIWEADKIREGFDIYKRFQNDTKAICKVLSKRNKKDIYSVFRFIFDGPHPDHEENHKIYKSIHPLIEKENPVLATILKNAFDNLLKQKTHGHH